MREAFENHTRKAVLKVGFGFVSSSIYGTFRTHFLSDRFYNFISALLTNSEGRVRKGLTNHGHADVSLSTSHPVMTQEE